MSDHSGAGLEIVTFGAKLLSSPYQSVRGMLVTTKSTKCVTHSMTEKFHFLFSRIVCHCHCIRGVMVSFIFSFPVFTRQGRLFI